jgi:acyl carrier protein
LSDSIKRHLGEVKEIKGGVGMKKYSREEIESGVREVIARCMQLETDEVKNDDLMKEDIGCDSIDCVEIVIELEKEFYINIPDNEVDAAAGWTVSELCDYVEERLKERKSQ